MTLTGQRLMERHAIASQEHESMEHDLLELESALEEASPGTVTKYRKLYEQSGGEQFRPDATKFKCRQLFDRL